MAAQISDRSALTTGGAKNLQRSSVQELKDTFLDNKSSLSDVCTAHLVNNRDMQGISSFCKI